jgi:hypothetical protein
VDALPAEVRAELVMNAAAIDGHVVTTHRFRTATPPDALLAQLRERWRRDGARVVESRAGDWTIATLRDDAGLRTLQLRATAHGTEGLVSQWQRPADRGAEEDTTFDVRTAGLAGWLPEDARILRRIAHRDPGRDAATLVAIVPGTAAQAASGLRRRASATGFEDDPAVGGPALQAAWYRGGPQSGGEALAFRRGREEVVATVAAHRDGAALVLHWGAPR